MINFIVYVFIGEHVALVHLVRVLAKKGAFDNGEYIVITIDDNYNISGKFFDIGKNWLGKLRKNCEKVPILKAKRITNVKTNYKKL